MIVLFSPGLNKTIESYDNQLSTLKRKIDFNNNTIYQQMKGLQKQRVLLGVQKVQNEDKVGVDRLIQNVVSRGPKQIGELQKMIGRQQMKKYLLYYSENNKKNEVQNRLQTLEYFINNGDQYYQIYKDEQKRYLFKEVVKYKQFKQWRGKNEWQIEIQGQSNKVNVVQQIDESTVIEHRQFRQKLLYDLSQLLYFFKGCKYQITTAEKGLGFQSSQHSKEQVTMVQSDIDRSIEELNSIIAYLTSKRLTAPLELKNSKKAYQVLVRQFNGYQANITTMEQQIRQYKDQIVELRERREKQVEKLTFLRKKVASCRPICEEMLSNIVKRQVKITGQINKLE